MTAIIEGSLGGAGGSLGGAGGSNNRQPQSSAGSSPRAETSECGACWIPEKFWLPSSASEQPCLPKTSQLPWLPKAFQFDRLPKTFQLRQFSSPGSQLFELPTTGGRQ